MAPDDKQVNTGFEVSGVYRFHPVEQSPGISGPATDIIYSGCITAINTVFRDDLKAFRAVIRLEIRKKTAASGTGATAKKGDRRLTWRTTEKVSATDPTGCI